MYVLLPVYLIMEIVYVQFYSTLGDVIHCILDRDH